MDNPRIKLQTPLIDRAAIFTGLTITVVTLATAISIIGGLPDQIPIHFTLSGKVTRMASKHAVWVLIGLQMIMFVSLELLARVPHLHNYGDIRLTDQNAQPFYQLSATFLRMVNALSTLLLGAVAWIIIRRAMAADAPGFWLINALIILLLAICVVQMIAMSRLKKSQPR